jgi:hypothetical protein
MEPPVRLLNEDAAVLRAHVSADCAKVRLHGVPVDVFRLKGKRCAQDRPKDILKGQRRGLRRLVE